MNIEINETPNWDQNYREFAEDLNVDGGRTERMISDLVKGGSSPVDLPSVGWGEAAIQRMREYENYLTDRDTWIKRTAEHYLNTLSQTALKRNAYGLRRANLERKRANTAELVGIDLVAENANPHGSRAIRRKVSHDARKGTKPGLFGRGSVRLTGADLVERHGRSALAVLSEDRFRKALEELNAAGRRLDLRAKTTFQKTVESLSEVMGRRVSV